MAACSRHCSPRGEQRLGACCLLLGFTAPSATARVVPVTAEVDAFMDHYIRRYSERDVEGVAELCLWPFLAIRGVPIHMSDREAVRDHFAAMIDAYRGSV